MYTRSYQNEEKDSVKIPEGYDGIAFRENEKASEETVAEDALKSPPLRAPWDEVKDSPAVAEPTMAHPIKNDSFLSGLFGKFNFGGLFERGGLFKNGHINLGSEEILLIGVALLLLFNKSGDKECAIMLLLLLFVG